MKKYLQYLNYVLRHKWYVMLACFDEDLYWQGLIHDNSKFLPNEFIPYARFFYGVKKNPRDKTGYYKPFDTGNMPFEVAWASHIHRNKHHWQWWVRCNDDGGIAVLPMPNKYAREMICDWVGAGKTQGFFPKGEDKYSETRQWYQKNKHKMQLNKETRKLVTITLASEEKKI